MDDNKSYKDMYHFNDNFFNGKTTREDYPSLNIDPDINSTIKDNPYRANVEIEKDELVLQPDLTALFKARGKTHKQGGIEVNLKPGSFVFSNDKSLALTEEECETYEFKKGGSHKAKDYTPAMVVKKNVDPEHYNTLISNITDIKKDDLAKKTSAMMLEKYIGKLGQIAFLQEKKKNLPDGIPFFSEGTPKFDPEVRRDIDIQKQYAKDGGYIKMQDGGKWDDYIKKARVMGMAPNGYNEVYSNPQGRLMQGLQAGNPYNVPIAAPGGPGNPPQWMNAIQNMINKGATLEQLTAGPKPHINKDGAKLFKWGQTPGKDDYVWIPKVGLPEINDIKGRNPQGLPGESGQDLSMNIPHPDEVPGDAQGPLTTPWRFTPWQKTSQGYNAAKYAGAKRYMPMRSQYDATYTEDYLVNPEQAVGDAKGMANQQINALSTLSPILRNAQSQSAYGQYLNQVPGIRSQYENQNAQIVNQGRQYRNQVKNNETLTNMQNDATYYQQSVVGRQNFDNLKTFLGDQYMNNVLDDVQTNQILAYNLLSRDNPAYNFDWRTGNFNRNPKNVMDARGKTGQDTWEAMIREAKSLSASGLSDSVISSLIKGKFFQQAAPYFSQSNSQFSNPFQQ